MSAKTERHEAERHEEPLGVLAYFAVYLALLALLGVTVWIATVELGRWNVFAALAIATLKTVLVVLYFMQVKRSIRMIKIYAGAAGVFLLIATILTFADYLTRPPAP